MPITFYPTILKYKNSSGQFQSITAINDDPNEVTREEFDTVSNNVRLLQDGRQNLLSGCVENSSNGGVVFTKLAETKIKAVGTGASSGSYYRFFFSYNSFPDWLEKGKRYYVKFQRENVNLNLNYYLNGWKTIAKLTGDGSFVCPTDALGFGISLAVESAGLAVNEIVEVAVTEAPSNKILQDEIDLLAPAVETISGSSVTITGEPNVRYVCGTVTSISITPPTSGTIDVVFTSGSTVAVLTLPSTVRVPEWFDASTLETNRTYEILITDGVYGVATSWPL